MRSALRLLRVKQVLSPLISVLYHIICGITLCLFSVISYRQSRLHDTQHSTDFPGELKDCIFLTFLEPCIVRCVFYITNEMQLIQCSLLLSAFYMFRAVECRQQESMAIPKAAHTVL